MFRPSTKWPEANTRKIPHSKLSGGFSFVTVGADYSAFVKNIKKRNEFNI